MCLHVSLETFFFNIIYTLCLLVEGKHTFSLLLKTTPGLLINMSFLNSTKVFLFSELACKFVILQVQQFLDMSTFIGGDLLIILVVGCLLVLVDCSVVAAPGPPPSLSPSRRPPSS